MNCPGICNPEGRGGNQNGQESTGLGDECVFVYLCLSRDVPGGQKRALDLH